MYALNCINEAVRHCNEGILQVAVTSKLSGKEAGKPTLLLTFKSDSFVKQVKDKTSSRR